MEKRTETVGACSYRASRGHGAMERSKLEGRKKERREEEKNKNELTCKKGTMGRRKKFARSFPLTAIGVAL